jgi:DNA-binding GntR family transcriptional regulator
MNGQINGYSEVHQMVVKRQFTGDIIYNELKQKIIELEYAPGTAFSEEMLTGKLGISRTPLRQALLRLELEGLIVRQSNGRLQVAPVSAEDAAEICQVREVLEGMIAREATQIINPQQIVWLEDTLELMMRAAQDRRIYDTIRYGSEFHRRLYELCKNQTAIQFLAQVNNRLERYRRLGGYENPGYDPMRSAEEHQAIFQAIVRKDPESAEQLMRAHIRRGMRIAVENLQLN